MKLDELTFEIKTKSGEYRPCLVADTKGFFHMWTPDGKAIVEFDDGTVSTVKAEDIRFLDTESLMVENACFSDEWIERFKNKLTASDKERLFFAKLSIIAERNGCRIVYMHNDNKNYYEINMYKSINGADIFIGKRYIHSLDFLYCTDITTFAMDVFHNILSDGKEVE